MSNSKINKNSISPNGIQIDSEGYVVFYPMGTNKINIPSNSPHWPKGSKLKGSFVYDKDDKLVDFCDTKAMTTGDNGIVVMPYEYIDTEFDSIEKDSIQIHAPKATYKKATWTDGEKMDIPDVQYKYKGRKNVTQIQYVDANYLENDIVDGKWTELLSELENGVNMFRENENIISFTSDLSSLTSGQSMFYKCNNLTSFEGDLSYLTHSYQMFGECSSLISFTSNLNSLTDGNSMFSNCSNLTSFDCSDLSSLTRCNSMFNNCSNLTSFALDLKHLITANYMFQNCYGLVLFKSDLSSLTDGVAMFDKCSNLVTFSSDLSSLTTANYMFQNCSKLTSFEFDLSSLTYGYSMFNGCPLTKFNTTLCSLTNGNAMFYACKLDAPSIKNIIDTINTVDSGELTLGMGCNNNTTDKDLFAQEVGYSDMTTLLSALQNKGWTVFAQFNSGPNSTFSLRKPESLPVYVKLVEVVLPIDEEEIPTTYEYTSQDGSKFYNLDWFHETTGSTESYTQFSSLEEAISHFNIKSISI